MKWPWRRNKSPLVPSILCGLCTQINIHSKFGFTHHDFQNLNAYATKWHCPLCKLFLDSVSSSIIEDNPSAEITIISKSRKLGYKFNGYGETVYDIVAGKGSRASGTTNEQHNTEQTSDYRLTSALPLDDQNLALILQWLLSCAKDHDRCKPEPGFSPPTRLLDIRRSQVRLSSPEKKDLRYAALSHCWGNAVHTVTTEANINRLYQKIDWATLPATFKDAITTSRKLNIDYIWIDSLCIIQDSRSDWEKECQHMGSYYKNSFITLSALDSSNSEAGFLHPRKNLAVRLAYTDTWIRPSGRMPNTIFRGSYLNKRGWTLQERLLSTRILHFSQDEVLWECQTCSASESSWTEHNEPVDISSLVSSEGQDFKRAALHLGPDPYSLTNGMFAAWYRIVKQFSRRSLTFESDRLPAISGIARLLGQRTGFTYLVGLWKEDPHGLVWCIDKAQNRVSHASTQSKHDDDQTATDSACPSWSWAKMPRSISWRFYEQHRIPAAVGEAKILSSTITSLSGDPYGVVQSAELTLEAAAIHNVQCMPGDWDARIHIRDFRIPHQDYIPPGQFFIHGHREGMLLNVYRDGVMIGTACYDDPGLDETVAECSVLHVANRKYDTSKHVIGYFLLVKRVEGEQGKWERIGMGVTQDRAWRRIFDEPEYFDRVFDGCEREFVTLR